MTMMKFGRELDPVKRIRGRQGSLIRKCRSARGISIDEFAASLGVTAGAVSQWETGRYTPRQAMQVKIANALNVPWSMIFDLDTESVVV